MSTQNAALASAIDALPEISQFTAEDRKEIVLVPVILQIPVDPLDGFTAEESIAVAAERLAELSLEVTLGGVPLAVNSLVPLSSLNTEH